MSHEPESRENPEQLFDEDEVDRILARAIELEAAQEGRIAESLLLEIAVEAGISPEAVYQALETSCSRRSAPARSFAESPSKGSAGLGPPPDLGPGATRSILSMPDRRATIGSGPRSHGGHR